MSGFRIYYTATDNGDGSLSVEFFDSQKCIDILEEACPEYYRGEGGRSFEVEGEITGIDVQTLADAKQTIIDMTGEDPDEDDDIYDERDPDDDEHGYATEGEQEYEELIAAGIIS